MRADGLLHAELLGVIAALGHGQTLVIADAGLAIPAAPRRIDVAIRRGSPAFFEVLDLVLAAGIFEGGVIAVELQARTPQFADKIRARLAGARLEMVSHEALKELTAEAVAIVRTGEFTSYANVVLRAGVPF